MPIAPENSLAGTEDLIGVIQDLSLSRSVEEIESVTRRAVRRLTGADAASFILRDGDFCHYVGEDPIGPLWKGERFPIEERISGWVMTHGEPVAITDIYADDRIPHDLYRPTFVTSLLVVPIRVVAPIGAIGVYWADHHVITDDEMRLLQVLATSTSVALENAAIHRELEARVLERTLQLEAANAWLQLEISERRRAEEEVRQLSLTDELTGLYNRRGFMLLASQDLKVVQRSGRRGLVIYIDLDGLKQTNDVSGHAAGDRLITTTASVLRTCARGADITARLGGDEFVVFMPLDGADPPIPAIVERFLAEARARDLHVSVGATATKTGETTTLDQLLKGADEAMYRGRRARRARQPA
jgi:diguanylate cyclase (GGDEF)-like protein